jgi:TRAP-type transport system small permease protein
MPQHPLLRAFERILSAFNLIFGLALGALIALMCVDILIRNLRVGSMPWLLELTEYVMYGGAFLAAPWVLRQGNHVRVDALLMAVPKRVAVALEIVVDLVGFGVSLVLLGYGAYAVWDAFSGKMMQYKTWTVSEGVLLLPIPIAALLLCIEFVLRICRVRGVVSEDYDPTKRASI